MARLIQGDRGVSTWGNGRALVLISNLKRLGEH